MEAVHRASSVWADARVGGLKLKYAQILKRVAPLQEGGELGIGSDDGVSPRRRRAGVVSLVDSISRL